MHRRFTKENLQIVVAVVVTAAALPVAYYIVYQLVGLQRVLATAALLGIAWVFHRLIYKPLARRFPDGKA